MASVRLKVEYVKRAAQDRIHECHWPGCEVQCPPAKWGCSPHWFRLPLTIRIAIWNAFKPGQEIKRNPKREYILAARRAQKWILNHSLDFKRKRKK